MNEENTTPVEHDIDGTAVCPHENAVFWNPFNHVVQCHRCGQIFMPTNVAPADAVLGFAGWLTSREEVAGPFSAHHEAGEMARLVGTYCNHQGWEVSAIYPHNIHPQPRS